MIAIPENQGRILLALHHDKSDGTCWVEEVPIVGWAVKQDELFATPILPMEPLVELSDIFYALLQTNGKVFEPESSGWYDNAVAWATKKVLRLQEQGKTCDASDMWAGASPASAPVEGDMESVARHWAGR